MRCQWFVCLLIGGLAYGQAAAPATPASPAKPAEVKSGQSAAAADKPAEPNVSPSDPVITVKGVCDDPSKQGDDCKTVVTREQFEKLANAIQPNMSPPVRKQLATYYPRLLAMTREAEKRGIDKQPQTQQVLEFGKMQILSQALTRQLQEESAKVTDSEIEKYYKENTANYEEATLLRIFVPRTKQVAPPKVTAAKSAPAKEESEAEEKAGEAAMKKAATELRARAAKGEDFDKLEKEAYTLAGLKQNAPPTKMEKVRSNTLPPAHKVALALKPGDVSEVISDPSGHYIYKLVSKETLPLETVKAEISNWVASQRFRDAMQAFQSNSDLNEAYFGPLKNPAMQPKPGQPPAQGEDVDPD